MPGHSTTTDTGRVRAGDIRPHRGAPVLPADARVADLGAGTGKAARQMARRGWQVTAIEPGEGMLDVLQARAAEEGLEIDARSGVRRRNGHGECERGTWRRPLRRTTGSTRSVRCRRWRASSGRVAEWPCLERSCRHPIAFLAEEVEVLARYLPEEHVDRYDEDDREPPEVIADSDKFASDDWVEFTHERSVSADEFVALGRSPRARSVSSCRTNAKMSCERSSSADRSALRR